MQRLFLHSCLLFFLTMGIGLADTPSTPPLKIVQFQLQAEKWAETSAARVVVGFYGSMDEKDMANLHQQVMENLKRMSKEVAWHITYFDRSKEASGLEKIYIQAEALLPESQLSELRKTAEKMSVPGRTYEIEMIDFSPSLADIQATKQALRNQIYEQVKAELATLNRLYSGQAYFLSRLTLDQAQPIPVPQRERVMMAAMGANAKSGATGQTLSVSQKILMTAEVECAALGSNHS